MKNVFHLQDNDRNMDESLLQVAEGGATHVRMPMLVIIPYFWGLPGYTMLGFGDIVLPGLLIVYTRIQDLASQLQSGGVSQTLLRHGYFLPAVVGYGVGLLLTYAALLLELGGKQVWHSCLLPVAYCITVVFLLLYRSTYQ